MLVTEAFAQEAVNPDTAAAREAAATLAVEQQAPYELSADKMLFDTLTFLALLFGIFYFLLIRPQQRRLKEQKAMLESVKKGSRIVTGGGILGTVVKQEDDDVLQVEIAPNVKVRIARGSIGEVLDEKGKSSGTANDN